jgi:hypothetical protein
MNENVVYIEVRHLDYWWGIYRLTKKTEWEDIIIYVKSGNRFNKIVGFCVCTKEYFRDSLEELEHDPDQKDFVNKIQEFLENHNIKYHFYYDNPNDEDFYEVPFEAQRNDRNIKPRSIELWYPSEGIDKETIDDCVKIFLKEFLDMNVERVEYKDTVCVEEAIKQYTNAMEQWQQSKGMVFSNELIETLVKEWNVSKEKVLSILNRSLK